MTEDHSRMGRLRMRLIGLLAVVAAGALVVALLAPEDTSAGDPVAARSTAAPTSRASEPPPSATPEPKSTKDCAQVIDGLSPRKRLAQLLMVGVDPSSPGSATKVAGKEGIGGIFLGGTDNTLLEGNRLAAVRDAAKLPLAVSVDEEGGRVQRVDDLDGDVPSAREMARTMSVAQVHKLARDRGAALRARGVTVDLAPVVDVTSQPDDEVIGDRSFGAEPAAVSRYAAAFAQGLQESGVLPVVKHFPGHGRVAGDSHQTAVSSPSLAELRKVDLVPYRKLLKSTRSAVMVGHMAVPGLTKGVPATLSPAAYQLLRREFAFDDVAMTDDLGGMQAISARYPLPKAVLAALRAGADIALWSSGEQYVGEVLDTLESALQDGTLPQARVTEALARVLRAKGACQV
jgi:beta-N-acetylhexosaminidase